MYQYRPAAANELQASIIYDDWGRQKTFEFDLPNGTYSVTVSVGWEGATYTRNFISIEGVSFVNDEASSPYLVRTREVTITDNKLTMSMGIFDEYTMLNYLDIKAVIPPPLPPVAAFSADITQGAAPLTVTFTDSSSNSPTGWQWDFDNDGSTDATSRNPMHVFTATGIYSVRLTAVNTAGSDDELQENYIQVIKPDTDTSMPWLQLLLGN
jgi:PKD repeat protein